MYRVKVRSHFSSAHHLREYKGKCEELHGHNWKVEVSAGKEKLDKAGMVIDFQELKSAVNKIMVRMDHKNLNEITPFDKLNPTSENIAQYMYEEIKRENPDLDIQEVTVWETDSSSATYSI